MEPADDSVSLDDINMADKWFGDSENGEHENFSEIACDLMNKEHCD